MGRGGALRIFPPWEVRAFGYEIPNPFPSVLLPGITFGLLYLWPFLERRVTSDHDIHHLLDRSRDRPARTALGAATISFYLVLFVAGSTDLLAKWFRIPIETLSWTTRVIALVAPPLVGWFVYRLMSALRESNLEKLSMMPLSALRKSRTSTSHQS